MNFNVLNGTAGETANTPINLTELDFWKNYVRLLSAINNSYLDWKEEEVLAHILAGDYHKSHFKGELAKEIKEKYRLNAPDLSRLKAKLISKNYIEDTGVQRGDAIPTRALRTFQRIVKSGKFEDITIIFPFKVGDERD